MKTNRLLALVLFLCVLPALAPAATLGTAFTYQGRLTDSAGAVSGFYDFQFMAYDAETNGTAVGSTLTTNRLAVSNGLFLATLDFGSSIFAIGQARWLQIEVRTNGAAKFTTLAPRQSLAPTPYALYAPNAGTAALASRVTAGSITSSSLAAGSVTTAAIAARSVTTNHLPINVPYLDASLQTFSGQNAFNSLVVDPFASNNGTLVSGLAFGSLASGEGIASKRTPDGNQYGLDFYTFSTPRISITGPGNVGIGTTTPEDALLDVEGNLRLNNFDLFLRHGSDRNHGIGWYGVGKPFAGREVDGPVVYGWSGGALGSSNPTNLALAWFGDGRVTVDPRSLNTNGSLVPGLVFGFNSGEGISSQRGGSGNQYGLDFYTYYQPRLSIAQGGNVGIGTTSPAAKLHVAGQVQITGGNPGAGKFLVSDANGLASWQPLSTFLFGQDYTPLLPDVIDNTVAIEITGVFTEDRVVMVNGPGLQIQRIPGFNGTNHMDEAGPNMEFPLMFEYSGSQTGALQTWYQQNQTSTNLRSMSIIVKDLSGAEQARWNLYEMAPTRIETGAGNRKRYTLSHALAPNNVFGYERAPVDFPTASSKNPATDGPRVEIDGVLLGPYPAVTVDTTNRTITLIYDYTEAGKMYEWVRETAKGLAGRRVLAIIQEVNGTEISRRNYFEVFPIWYQQTTGFGQIQKLKEKVVLAYGWDESG
jgi:hypothetical protein